MRVGLTFGKCDGCGLFSANLAGALCPRCDSWQRAAMERDVSDLEKFVLAQLREFHNGRALDDAEDRRAVASGLANAILTRFRRV